MNQESKDSIDIFQCTGKVVLTVKFINLEANLRDLKAKLQRTSCECKSRTPIG